MKTEIFGRTLFLLCLLFTTTSCDDLKEPAESEQKVFFLVTYRNFAWGEQHRGFFLTKGGQIKTYDTTDNLQFADRIKELSEKQMEENLSKTKLSSVKVSIEDLKYYSDKISSIKTNQYSPPINIGNDRGELKYYALKYDAARKIYELSLLAEKGDRARHNTDETAVELTAWLTEIEALLY